MSVVPFTSLFTNVRIETFIGGTTPEFVGITLSMKSDKYTRAQLLKYTQENCCHARCIIEDEWVYGYCGELVLIEDDR